MKKDKLLSYKNGDKIEIDGVKLQVEITECCDSPFLKFKMQPITPLHLETYLGGKWIEYITDEECETFEDEVRKHKQEALEFLEKSKRIVKATLTTDNRIKIIELPESVKADWDFYDNAEQKERALKRFVRETHPITFVTKEKTEFFAIGNFTLDLDGVLYVPHWSYWLDRAYYIATQQITDKAL